MRDACPHQVRASPDWRPRVVGRPWTSRDSGRWPRHVRSLSFSIRVRQLAKSVMAKIGLTIHHPRTLLHFASADTGARRPLDSRRDAGATEADTRLGLRSLLWTALPLRTSAAIAVTPRTPFRDWNSGTQKANSRHLRGFHFPANIICLQLNSQSI